MNLDSLNDFFDKAEASLKGKLRTWTVVGCYIDGSQPFVAYTEATNPHAAKEQVRAAVALEEGLELAVNGVIEGRHDVH